MPVGQDELPTRKGFHHFAPRNHEKGDAGKSLCINAIQSETLSAVKKQHSVRTFGITGFLQTSKSPSAAACKKDGGASCQWQRPCDLQPLLLNLCAFDLEEQHTFSENACYKDHKCGILLFIFMMGSLNCY